MNAQNSLHDLVLLRARAAFNDQARWNVRRTYCYEADGRANIGMASLAEQSRQFASFAIGKGLGFNADLIQDAAPEIGQRRLMGLVYKCCPCCMPPPP
jgi:hypothetical protein